MDKQNHPKDFMHKPIYTKEEQAWLDVMQAEITAVHDELERIRGHGTEEETKLKFKLIDLLHQFNNKLDHPASSQQDFKTNLNTNKHG